LEAPTAPDATDDTVDDTILPIVEMAVSRNAITALLAAERVHLADGLDPIQDRAADYFHVERGHLDGLRGPEFRHKEFHLEPVDQLIAFAHIHAWDREVDREG
jgi:hypothetical protein